MAMAIVNGTEDGTGIASTDLARGNNKTNSTRGSKNEPERQ